MSIPYETVAALFGAPDRLTPEQEARIRDRDAGSLTVHAVSDRRALLAELDAVRAERDQALARANELPGLTAALDEARWERDVAKGEQTAGCQALAEVERLHAELADVRARFEEKLREPIPVLRLEGSDAKLARLSTWLRGQDYDLVDRDIVLRILDGSDG